MNVDPLLAALRASTSDAHQRLEDAFAILDTHLDRAGYVRLLARFYGAYAPLEANLAVACDGEALGRQIMTSHFQQHLGLTPERGLAFFASYGSAVGARWGASRAFLAARDAAPALQAAATQAARTMFEAFASWLPAEAAVL